MEMTIEQRIEMFSASIDEAGEKSDLKKINDEILSGEDLLSCGLSDDQNAFLHFCLSNAFITKRLLSKENSWDSICKTQSLIHLRKSLRYLNQVIDSKYFMLKARVLTNLGLHLYSLNRMTEAVSILQDCVFEYPDFRMAHGALGRVLFTYSLMIQDSGHSDVLRVFAYKHFETAINLSGYIEPDALDDYKNEIIALKDYKEVNLSYFSEFSYGIDSEDANYRQWCCQNVLFLNPLNDVTSEPICNQDILHMPEMNVPIGSEHESYIHGIYNSMKQTYATSRWILYEYSNKKYDNHAIADRDLYLIDGLDYTIYNHYGETLLMALSAIYSIFNRMPFLIS